jgi:hypothetical protein
MLLKENKFQGARPSPPFLKIDRTRVLHREGPELRGEDGMKEIEAQAIMALIRAPDSLGPHSWRSEPRARQFDFSAVLISSCSFSARRNYNSEN